MILEKHYTFHIDLTRKSNYYNKNFSVVRLYNILFWLILHSYQFFFISYIVCMIIYLWYNQMAFRRHNIGDGTCWSYLFSSLKINKFMRIFKMVAKISINRTKSTRKEVANVWLLTPFLLYLFCCSCLA